MNAFTEIELRSNRPTDYKFFAIVGLVMKFKGVGCMYVSCLNKNEARREQNNPEPTVWYLEVRHNN